MDAVLKPPNSPQWRRLVGRVVDFVVAMETRPIDDVELRLACLERRLAALEGDAARDHRLPNTRNV